MAIVSCIKMYHKHFLGAMLCKSRFLSPSYVTIASSAKEYSRKSCDEYLQVDPSGEIVVLSQGVPWSQHLFELEKEQNIQPPLKYIIFGDGNFRIRSVPVDNGSFLCRYLHGIT